MIDNLGSGPSGPFPSGPLDPAALARMASALFGALPGQPGSSPYAGQPGAPAGVQAPVNIAPAGSPLVSPAGFGPGVPGTPILQGQVPGTNLLPASPTPVLSLANRAPSLLPHAPAGNGVPDHLVSTVPAYEPRLGGALLGVPQAQTAPQYYFVDSVVLRDGYVTPAMPGPHGGQPIAPYGGQAASPYGGLPLAGSGQHAPFDIHAVRRDFPILQERVNGRQLVWFDNAATTQKPQAVIDRLSYFYAHENANVHRAAHELAARDPGGHPGRAGAT